MRCGVLAARLLAASRACGQPCLRLRHKAYPSACRRLNLSFFALNDPPPPAEDAAKGTPQQPCDALQQLLALESRQQGADGGRPAGASRAARDAHDLS